MSDLPAVQDDPNAKDLLPKGNTIFHGRTDSQEIWRLCCRLRLDMRTNGLGIKDALLALSMAYPDLKKASVVQLRHFMEEYVDPAIIVDPSFWKKGLMRATGRLNAVAEAANIAESMHEAFENIQPDDVKPEDLPKYMLAGERAMKARERQFDMMTKVGMGPQSEKDRATPGKPTIPPPTVHVAGDLHLSLSEAVGGSFARRNVVDVEGKEKAPGSA